MTTPAWQPGTLYLPGALVVPRSTPAPQPVAIVNGDLEAGTTAWNFGGNVVLDTGFRFAGTNSLRVNGTGDITLLNTTAAACTQGQVVKASCMYHQGSAGEGENTGRVLLQFLDAASAVLSTVQGNVITSSSGGWKKSSVTGVAPANTAFVKIGAFSHKTKSAEHQFDAFQWDVSSVTQGLMYKAVQAAAGTSDDVEPAWPTTLGVTVVDNTVTWEAVAISRIVWSPQAAMVSGATEPTWPTGMGTRVADGQVAWEAIPRRIEDENCPHSKVVVIASSKVYAADDDVVRYCATVNPYDWSTANDAGYLPYGLQQYGANPIAAMGLYRSNLVIFNAQAFQMWQVDEDPANSALLDALPIGSTWHKALAPVSNDLFFNSAQGVRTVSIAGGSTNLAAGDVGMPIDPLVQEAMLAATGNNTKALATYVPSAGQYWLAFSDYPAPALTVTGNVPDGAVGEAVSGAYSVSGGVLPYGNFTVVAGSFPPGLTLNPDGTYSGAYTTGGSYAWTVQAIDAAGTTAAVDDTATVLVGEWWVTNYNAGVGAIEDDLYISQNPLSFGASVVRSPFVQPEYGPKSGGVGVVLVGGDSTSIEQITDTDPGGGIATTVIDVGITIRHIRTFDNATIILPKSGTGYRYSTDQGATWQAGAFPGSLRVEDIARLSNGRWLGLASGIGGGFYYSDEDVPTLAAHWTYAAASDVGGGGHASGYIATTGTSAISFSTTNCKRTTDGLNWSAVGTLGDADLSDGTSISGVYVCQLKQRGSIYRSTDDGLTFAEVFLSGVQTTDAVQRLEVGGGAVVACTSGSKMWVSTDNGATWVESTTPGSAGKRATYLLRAA